MADAASGAALWLLRAAPARARRWLAAFVAWLAWTLRIRRRVSLDNLAQALPQTPPVERRALARGAYRTMSFAALDAVTSDLLPASQLGEVLKATDWKGLDVLMRERRPVLVASAHFGSWELLSEVLARQGCAVSAVVRPLSGAINARIIGNRLDAGLELIHPRGALRGMLSALRRGRTVAQLIDQALPARHGVFVPFFGRLACTTPALSMAALRSGAPVYVVLAARRPSGALEVTVEGPVPLPDTGDRRADVQAHTAALTACLERAIRRQPEQWLWLHRRWKVQPQEFAGAPQQVSAD